MLISRHLPHTRTKFNIKYAEINSSRGYGQKQCHSKVRGRRLWLEPPPPTYCFYPKRWGKSMIFLLLLPSPVPILFSFTQFFCGGKCTLRPPPTLLKSLLNGLQMISPESNLKDHYWCILCIFEQTLCTKGNNHSIFHRKYPVKKYRKVNI